MAESTTKKSQRRSLAAEPFEQLDAEAEGEDGQAPQAGETLKQAAVVAAVTAGAGALIGVAKALLERREGHEPSSTGTREAGETREADEPREADEVDADEPQAGAPESAAADEPDWDEEEEQEEEKAPRRPTSLFSRSHTVLEPWEQNAAYVLGALSNSERREIVGRCGVQH